LLCWFAGAGDVVGEDRAGSGRVAGRGRDIDDRAAARLEIHYGSVPSAALGRLGGRPRKRPRTVRWSSPSRGDPGLTIRDSCVGEYLARGNQDRDACLERRSDDSSVTRRAGAHGTGKRLYDWALFLVRVEPGTRQGILVPDPVRRIAPRMERYRSPARTPIRWPSGSARMPSSSVSLTRSGP